MTIRMTFTRPPMRARLLLVLAIAPAAARAQDLAEKSHQAKELMASGKFVEAATLYRELVRAVPNNPGLITNLGMALDMSGDKTGAVREYQAALRLDPDQFPALLLLGSAYLDLGQPSRAVDALGRALKIQPGSLDAQEILAEALLASGRPGEAVRRFQALSDADPKNSKVWYGLGVCYERLAQQSFDALAKAAPGSGYWLDLVAESRLETKQDYSAFYFYHQALAKMPSMRGVHAAIAEVYKDSGHPDWADVEEQKERQLPPPDCNTQKLECDFQAGRFLEIVAATDQARDPEAYYWRTRACNKLALDAYLRLGELPPSEETHELKAKIASDRRQYAEAAKEWRQALQLSPGNSYVEKELAIARYKSGDLAGAQTLFEELLKRQPEEPDLNFYLGDTILNSQNARAAIPYLEKALQGDPHLLPAQRSLGLAYLQAGQADKAIPHLKAALPVDEDGSLHYQLGRAYQASGQRELASAMLKQYQELHGAQQSENAAVEKDVAITPPE
ncbi:MAG TPA: tetratricopeptide repeat protein [Terriglobia bacterium]